MDFKSITLKKSEIGIRWKKYCSISTNNTPANRLLFVLSHYQLYIEKAANDALNAETEITCIQELVNLMKGCNRPSIMNDYYSIMNTIENENENENEDNDNYTQENEDLKIDENISNTNNNNNGNKKQPIHEIRAYMQSKLGQCKNYSNCKCFVRNRRPRSSDDVKNERREAFFIRAEDVRKYETDTLSRFEVKEVVLQSSLDIIHNYIFHSEDEQTNVNSSHTSKFVTDMGMDENDTKTDNNNNQTKVKKIGQYSFGCNLDYWKGTHHDYVAAKYPDLKTELTANSIHPISIFAYEALEEQARDILMTDYGKSLRSKREHEWMKVNSQQLIPTGSLITERHLISVLAYTNHDKMQFEFKKQGFRTLTEYETDADVRKRNAEIAHWNRAIYEVIHCWGSVMNRKKPYFHGINCKLLFHRFSTSFNLPTSLTTNVRIAKNFAKEDGIILVLKHAGEKDVDSLMFDVSLMSDYPNEEERLIFSTRAQFSDIIVNGCSLNKWMKVLRIYDRIRVGLFLAHVPFSPMQQELMVHMIENYMENEKNGGEDNEVFHENGNVPNYIQLLFNQCTDAYAKYFINYHENSRSITNEKLLQYLDGSQNGKNSKFLSLFETVTNVPVYEWKVTGDEYDSYFSNYNSWVIDQQRYRIKLSKESDADPIYLDFYWKIKNYRNDGLLRCMLICDTFPSKVRDITMYLGIYIEETKSEATCYSFLNQRRFNALTLHSIVDSKRLKMENNKAMKRKEFNVKLLFSLFSVQYK